MTRKLVIFGILTVLCGQAHALSMIGRLGMGTSNQLRNDTQTISLKIQRNKSYSLGALFGVKTGDETNYGAGLKLYRKIYDEPQLNFYLAGLGGLYTYQNSGETESGYQFDGTFGTEYHFQGLESIGFSFEFGLSLNKYNGVNNFETVGYNILQAAVHFYL